MDTLAKIRSYQEQANAHDLQCKLLLSILNNRKAAIYIGQMPPDPLVSVLHADLQPTHEYYKDAKALVQKMAEYHTARKLWYKEQLILLQQQQQQLQASVSMVQ